MKSKIANDVEFDRDGCVVSLVKHNDHGIILLESQKVDGKYELKKIDFVPAGKYYCFLYGADFGQLFMNTTYPGAVNDFVVTHKTKSIENCNRDDIFNQLKLKKESISWVLSRDKIRNMMNIIQNERISPPVFNIKGKRNHKEAGHNCCTWAIERLSMIENINVSDYLKSGTIAYHLSLPSIGTVSYTISRPFGI
jgi:hypothetical protein